MCLGLKASRSRLSDGVSMECWENSACPHLQQLWADHPLHKACEESFAGRQLAVGITDANDGKLSRALLSPYRG